jgi:PKD repeat protein
MYPTAGGTALAQSWTVGQSKTFSFKEAIPAHIYDKTEIATVAWVQDDATKNVKQAGFSEFATTPSALAPLSDFNADVVEPCDGLVHFSDASALFPTSWLWDFGDGHTSTAQNPMHTYLASGNYTVSLTATNANGSDQVVKTSYIQVVLTGTAPLGINDNICLSGVANLSATPTNGGTITWYDGSGAVVGTGATYSPTVTGTTDFYAAEAIANAQVTTGASDTSIATGGIFFTANNTHGLYFDVDLPCTLESVNVYSGASGARTIVVIDAFGNTVHTLTTTLPVGLNTIPLGFHLTVGQGYLIKISSTIVNLFRNAGGATYPYVTDAITITGNTAGSAPTNYYFFYDWKVKQDPCMSPLATVTALDTCAVSAEAPTTLAHSLRVSPNPSHGTYNLAFEAARKDNYTISVTNVVGQVVFSQVLNAFQGSFAQQIDLSDASNGIYFLAITDSRGKVVKKLVKE